MAWWLMIVIAIFLLWRNEEYDWVIAFLAIPLALIQLIEWGAHTGAISLSDAAKYLYMTLWLQLFIFALLAFLYTKYAIAGLWVIIMFGFLLYGLSYAWMANDDIFDIEVDNNNLIWKNDGDGIFGPFGIIYFVGIILPFLFMIAYYNWIDVGLWILLAYVLFSALFAWLVSGSRKMGSTWCYLAVGFLFLAWLAGIARSPFPCSNV